VTVSWKLGLSHSLSLSLTPCLTGSVSSHRGAIYSPPVGLETWDRQMRSTRKTHPVQRGKAPAAGRVHRHHHRQS